MTYQDVLDYITANPICAVATREADGQPRARYFLTVQFDDKCLYFTTSTRKRVYGQIANDPRVELCYFNQSTGVVLRIETKIEVVEDLPKKQQLVRERDYLKGFKAEDPEFKLLRISHGKAWFWTMKDNLKEATLPIIEF